MKITCERCRAEHEVPDAKIPPSGFKMSCPACQNEIVVPPSGQAAAPSAPVVSREIALSAMEDDGLDLPAPASKGAPAMAAPKPVVDEPDLPTPRKGPPPRPLVPPSKAAAPDVVDLPAPRIKPPAPAGSRELSDEDAIDLPAPIGLDLPTPAVGKVDLPAPKADLPTPVVKADLPTPVGKIDLPRPAMRSDALKPKAPPPIPRGAPPPPPVSKPPIPAQTSDTFQGDSIALDLDAPDVDDLPSEEATTELTPKADSGVDLPTPRADGSVDLPTPVAGEVAPVAASLPRANLVRTGSAAVMPGAAPEEERPKNRKKSLVITGAVVVVLAGGGVGALKLISINNAKHAVEARLVAARHAIADDTAAGLKKAIADLKSNRSDTPTDDELAVEAQAHFMLARLGVPGELQAGKSLLEQATTASPSAERHRAEGARDLAAGDLVGAKKTLRDLMSTGADAAAMSYLGEVDLLGRDDNAAKGDFGHALEAEATRPQAAYGLGLANERLGADPAAKAAYQKVIGAVPDHVRARLGLLRIAARAGDADAPTKIDALLVERANSLAPRERAEALVAIGDLALENGRSDEAEDRYKKAITLDGQPALSLVAQGAKIGLARVNVRLGRGGESIEDLRKIIALDAKGLEARLLLTEALLDKNDVAGATAALAGAEKLAPKDARIVYLRGRTALAKPSPSAADREEAVARFREATVADSKLIAAWTALAHTLGALGRDAEAVDALDKAAAALTADPRGAAQIADAYLAIHRYAGAEQRFRAALEAQKARSANEKLPLWLGLGAALEGQGKLDDAATVYADAQKELPKSAAILERRGRLALRQDKKTDAAALFDEAMKLGTPTVALRITRAELALAAGDVTLARTLAEAAQHDDDRSAAALLLVARVELASNHLDTALSFARHAATLQDLPGAHLVIAQVSEQMNKLEAALGEYVLAEKPPFTEEATLGHARVLVRQGATKGALPELVSLTKSAAMRGPASLLAGDCYADLRQADKARAAYADAEKAMPTSADVAFKLGRAELDAGHRGPGVAALERALKMADPKTAWVPDAYLLLGDSHRAAGAKDAAIRAYTKFLEVAPANAATRTEAARQITLLGGTPPATP